MVHIVLYGKWLSIYQGLINDIIRIYQHQTQHQIVNWSVWEWVNIRFVHCIPQSVNTRSKWNGIINLFHSPKIKQIRFKASLITKINHKQGHRTLIRNVSQRVNWKAFLASLTTDCSTFYCILSATHTLSFFGINIDGGTNRQKCSFI